jgi:hypothetical protein
VTKSKPAHKCKKLDVPAGKSVCTKLFGEPSTDEMDFQDLSTSLPKLKKGGRRGKQELTSESENSRSFSLHDKSASNDDLHFSVTGSEYGDSDEDVGTIKEILPAPNQELLKLNLKVTL